MTRRTTQVWHDYKPQGKPKPKAGSAWDQLRLPRLESAHLRWFLAGIGISAAILALQFLSGTQSPVQEPLAGTSHPGFQLTGVPLELPGTPSETQVPTQAPVKEAAVAPGEVGQAMTLTVRPGDSMDSLFGRNNLNRADLAEILKLEAARNVMRLVHPGDTIQIRQLDGKILRLNRKIDETRELEVTLSDAGSYQTRIIERPLETRVVYAHGTIKNSLFLAGLEAGMSDKIIMNLAGIFAWDVDFVLDIRENDAFVVLYEELWQDGSRVRDGEILAAEFVNNGEALRAIRYTDAEGRSDYFSPEGNSMRKAFIRAPVDFTRISSNFNPNRKHPVLNKIRAHKGVDYAAPTGTPIKAAGDGKVIFAGRKGGYGNCVILQHGGNITTLYAHLSKFSKNGRVGKRVTQGEVVGYVGATGLATAPHLHYEYRLNGVHRNPRTVKLPQANPVAAKYRADFLAEADAMMSQLDMVRQTRLAAVAAD